MSTPAPFLLAESAWVFGDRDEWTKDQFRQLTEKLCGVRPNLAVGIPFFRLAFT